MVHLSEVSPTAVAALTGATGLPAEASSNVTGRTHVLAFDGILEQRGVVADQRFALVLQLE